MKGICAAVVPSMSPQARLALEWWRASGPRTKARLAALVDHWCDTDGIRETDTRRAIQAEAERNVQD